MTTKNLKFMEMKHVPLIALCCLLVSFTFIKEPQDPKLVLPVAKDKSKLGSVFGDRIHPVLGIKKFHTGLDIVAQTGESVLASMDGIVTASHFDNARGNFIEIKHSETLTTTYSHLHVLFVKNGQSVKASQAIGNVGKTGLATSPHLHFEVLMSGKAVDPQPYITE